MPICLEENIDYSDNTANIKIEGEGYAHLYEDNLIASNIAHLQSNLEQIASQIQDFRINNFPESTEIKK